MYASASGRDADIEAGASRPPLVIVEDVLHASRALEYELDDLPIDKWARDVVFHTTSGPKQLPAVEVVNMRLREVEIHHVDLDVGHDFTTTLPETLHLMLGHAVDRLSNQIPQRVELSASDLGVAYTIAPIDAPGARTVHATATAAQLLRHLTERGEKLAGLPPLPAWG